MNTLKTEDLIHMGIEFATKEQFKDSGPTYRSGVGFGYSCGYQDAMNEFIEERNRYREALDTILDWKFPETGKFWDKENKEPMSFSACWGSNGQRDYMQQVARAALFNIPFKNPFDFTENDSKEND